MTEPRPGIRRVLSVLATMLLLVAACSSPEDEPVTIRVLTHDDFDVPQEAIDDFTERTGVHVAIFREPSSTAIVELLERTQGSSIADVVLGIDSLDLARAVDSRVLEAYTPIDIDPIDQRLRVEGDWATPVSTVTTCLNRLVTPYVQAALPSDELPDPGDVPPVPPSGLDSLLEVRHASRAALPDPGSSRMGLYFLIALDRRYPSTEDTTADSADGGTTTDDQYDWTDFTIAMLQAGVRITDTWESAYFGFFAREPEDREGLQDTESPDADIDDPSDVTPAVIFDDEYTLTWGSTGMPAVSVRFQPTLPEAIDIAVIDDGCIEIVHYAALVRGTPARRNAGRVVDAMVEPLFQFQIADRFGSRPARTDLIRTDAWAEHGTTVDDVVTLVPEQIGPRWPALQARWNQLLRAFETSGPPPPPETVVTLPNR